MNVYRVDWGDRLILGIALVFLAILPIIMLALLNYKAAAEKIPWVPFLPISLIAAWFFYAEFLCVPYEVTIRDDHRIECRSVLRDMVIDPHEIVSVKPGLFQRKYLKLRFVGGAVNLSKRMDGLDRFLQQLKTLNPRVETKMD